MSDVVEVFRGKQDTHLRGEYVIYIGGSAIKLDDSAVGPLVPKIKPFLDLIAPRTVHPSVSMWDMWEFTMDEWRSMLGEEK